MSRQSLLHTYFKSNKVAVSPGLSKSIMKSDGDKIIRKRTLSLKKSITPTKSPKVTTKEPPTTAVIDLCSDNELTPPSSSSVQNYAVKVENTEADDEIQKMVFDLINDYNLGTCGSTANVTQSSSSCTVGNASSKNTNGYSSDSSQDTVIYSPPMTPCTPRRAPETFSPFKSPNSSNKYFSPNKKRAVFKKITARKNLTADLSKCNDFRKNVLFDDACKGMDDKTIFLLTIVNKCISKPSLHQLLSEESQQLLLKCMQVAKPGMRLVCRLYWHKDSWYKLDKVRSLLSGTIETLDDPTVYEALNSLQTNGFLVLSGSDENVISFDDYTTILSAEDLKQICKDLKLKINSKQGAIAALKCFSRAKSIVNFYTTKSNDNSSRVLKIMSAKAGPLYKLSDLARKTLYDLYILMYLGINYDVIRDKGLELTLLYDKINRETYPVAEEMLDDASVVFTNRHEFNSYVKAHDVHEEYLIENDSSRKCDIVLKILDDFKNITYSEMLHYKSLPVWLRRYTPMYIYVKILESGVQELKKEKRFGLALEVLEILISQDACRQHKKAEWYAEKALVLHKCNRTEEAAKVLLEGFKSDIPEEAKDTMRPRAKIFAKQKTLDLDNEVRAELLEYATKEDIMEKNMRGVHVYKQPMERIKQKGKLKFETRTLGERIVQDVEEYCLTHYISSGEFTDGMHWEGRIATTLFFLLFWDIIYWKPPNCKGLFLCRFQRFPLDLYCESFYENRKDSIDARLLLIERCSNEEISAMLLDKWSERPENENSGISRDSVKIEHLRAVASCLGGRGLAALCRRLVTQYSYAHSGFPDLTLWNTHTNQIRFVEVKSDTDKPSMKQIQWMHYLQRHGIDTEFCYVGVNTTRCKARAIS